MNRMSRCWLALAAVGAMACGSAAEPGKNIKATDASGDTPDGAVVGMDAAIVAVDVAPDLPPDLGPDLAPQCTKDTDCDDANPCTDDICGGGICSHLYNKAPCNDGDPCTKNDGCKDGACAGSGTCVDIVQDTSDIGTPPIDIKTSDIKPDVPPADIGTPTVGCSAAEWQSTQGDAFITKMNTCATQCITTPTKACVIACIKPAASLSDGCAVCMGDLADCAATKCLTQCLQPTSAGCKGCAAKNCGAALSTCSGFSAPNCGANGDCNDNDACTTDTCDAMFCKHTPAACDDAKPCTTDSCDAKAGCQHAAVTAATTCDDGDACTKDDACSSGACAGTAIGCDDGLVCTGDSCDKASGCVHVPLTGDACSDADTCTEGDACQAGVCVAGPTATCDDKDACTTDSCAAASGCAHAAVSLDDSNVCTIDSCDAASGVAHTPINPADKDPCTTDSCDPVSGIAHAPASGAPCDDANPCTTGDTCQNGLCQGTTKDCNDSNACTADACGLAGACTHTDISSGCVDGKVCTDDGCAPTSGCTYTDNKGPCEDGDVCTLSDSCDGGSCAPGSAKPCADANDCTADSCANPGGCAHDAVSNGSPCSDDNACTLLDSCGGGLCLAGALTPCDDGDPCSLDSCNPKGGACVHSPGPAGVSCNDGDACTTSDVCNATGVCAGTNTCPPPLCTTEPRLILDGGSGSVQILGVAVTDSNVIIGLNDIGGAMGTGKVLSCTKVDGCGVAMAGANVLKSGLKSPAYLLPHDSKLIIGDNGNFGSGAADGVVLDCDIQGCDVSQTSLASGLKSLSEVVYLGGTVAWYAYNGGPAGTPGISLYDLASSSLLGATPLDGAIIGVASDGAALYSSSQYSPMAIRKTTLLGNTVLLGDSTKGGGAHRYGLSAAGGWLYWASSLTPNAGVWRMTTAGTNLTQIKADADSPRNVVVDGTNVYYKNYYGSADLKAVSLVDGSVRILSSGTGQSQGWPNHRVLAVDGQCVYWGTTGGSVYAVKK